MDEDRFTRGEKSARDKACYLIVQLPWLLLHLPRMFFAGLVWVVRGEAAARSAWRKIFTPANFLTSARFVLWGKAILLFLAGAPLAEQTLWLFFALATDFFDGPMARLNGEVTELGTYLDHGGDWGVTAWVIFLSIWYGTLELPFLFAALGAVLLLFAVNIAKFLKFRDPSVPLIENVGAFAAEELQTDFWGRVQFVSLAVALFGGLFIAVSGAEGFLFAGFMRGIGESARTITYGALALSVFLGGYNAGDALNYSELKAKKFREKLRKFKDSTSSSLS
ncbi:MAG: CDP-alcohol phosphatidyltransferase family protein [Candidatus Liptonbacteria bacterium]|nr:CDP-alcohol phosphatidyltransferase family protein [Candidatus Liptonbacteria bacterium]